MKEVVNRDCFTVGDNPCDAFILVSFLSLS
jgi:hypothetical protein